MDDFWVEDLLLYFRIPIVSRKMSHQLSTGALAKICQGEEITDPVLQVLDHKPFRGCLFLSDGQFSYCYCFCHSNQLAPFTIIKVEKHKLLRVGQPPNKESVGILIEQVEIVSPGSQVGVKVGDPTPIGPDGKIPDTVEAKLTALR